MRDSVRGALIVFQFRDIRVPGRSKNFCKLDRADLHRSRFRCSLYQTVINEDLTRSQPDRTAHRFSWVFSAPAMAFDLTFCGLTFVYDADSDSSLVFAYWELTFFNCWISIAFHFILFALIAFCHFSSQLAAIYNWSELSLNNWLAAYPPDTLDFFWRRSAWFIHGAEMLTETRPTSITF